MAAREDREEESQPGHGDPVNGRDISRRQGRDGPYQVGEAERGSDPDELLSGPQMVPVA